MTFEQFSPVFAMLALQLRSTDADEPTAKSYFRAMRDEAVEGVALAAERLAQRAQFFPKTSEWLAAIRAVERERADQVTRAIAARRTRGLPALCADCDDTGFRRLENGRVAVCACQQMRKLEMTGVRPVPTLPRAPEPPDRPVDARVTGAVQQLAAAKGMR